MTDKQLYELLIEEALHSLHKQDMTKYMALLNLAYEFRMRCGGSFGGEE